MKPEQVIRMGLDHAQSELNRFLDLEMRDTKREDKEHWRLMQRDERTKMRILQWVLGEE